MVIDYFQPNVDLVIRFPEFFISRVSSTPRIRATRSLTAASTTTTTTTTLPLTTTTPITTATHHLVGNLTGDVCEGYEAEESLCHEEGLLLPFWHPTDNVSRVYIAILQLIAFAYIFIGVSLLSGRVMMAVEVITSKVKVVTMIRDREGKLKPVTRPYWSDTVANLTLYVLGFSAPEILITLVEIAKHGFSTADLGPETIVGSRAYHLFIITAICIVSVPRNEAKRVRRLRVYMITSFFSIFAYVWIFLIVQVFSKEVIEIWEGLVTFSLYPIVVVTAWLFERYNFFKRKPVRSNNKLVRRNAHFRRISGARRSKSNPSFTSSKSHETSVPNALSLNYISVSTSTATPNNNTNNNNNININNHLNRSTMKAAPLASQEDVGLMMYNNNNNKESNNEFRRQISKSEPPSIGDTIDEEEGGDDGDDENAHSHETMHAPHYFLHYRSPNISMARVVKERKPKLPKNSSAPTLLHTAGHCLVVKKAVKNEMKMARELLWLRLKALKDRFPGRSQIELETMAEMSYLHEIPKNQSYYRIMTMRQFAGEGDVITREKIRAKLLLGIAAPTDKKTEHVEKRRRLQAGEQRVFFCPAHYVVVECEPFVEIKVMREGAMDRAIEVSYETCDGTASAGDDYMATSGKLLFAPHETSKTIAVPIIDDEEYEDDEYFSVKLTRADYIEDVLPGSHNEESQPFQSRKNSTVSLSGAGRRHFIKSARVRKQQQKPIELGPHTEALVTILDDDHCGVFSFPGASLVVPDNLPHAEVKVGRSLGAHGRIVVPFILSPVNAVLNKDYKEPTAYSITFEHRELEKTIKIPIIDRQRAGDDSVFMLKLFDPTLIDEPIPKRSDGLPRVGEQCNIKVVITESEVMKDTLDRLQAAGDLGSLFRTTWRSQFRDAITLQPTMFVQQDDGAMMGASRRPRWYEYVLHGITLPWKLAFATLPPTGICNGWVAFFSCIGVVGIISILIEDLSANFGCVCGIEKSITAITVVAIGTSLPDMFASRAAAVHEKTADAALAHISGSNAVNVYIGLGLAWTLAALHGRFVRGALVFKPTCTPHHLAVNVLIFFVFSIAGLGVLIFRRFSRLSGRAELGGPLPARLITAGILVILYIGYIVLTVLVNTKTIVIPLL